MCPCGRSALARAAASGGRCARSRRRGGRSQSGTADWQNDRGRARERRARAQEEQHAHTPNCCTAACAVALCTGALLERWPDATRPTRHVRLARARRLELNTFAECRAFARRGSATRRSLEALGQSCPFRSEQACGGSTMFSLAHAAPAGTRLQCRQFATAVLSTETVARA
eukprot:478359-Pleurochrysis_carterae.AAC.1